MKIQLKRSSVLDSGVAKKPLPDQMQYGELAINYNSGDPTIFLKDSDNNIVGIELNKLGTIEAGTIPPTEGNNIGDLFFNTSTNALLFWDGTEWVSLTTELGYTASSNGGTITNSAGSNAVLTLANQAFAGLMSSDDYTKLLNTVGVELATPSNGLSLSSNNKLQANIATANGLGTVKIGSGIDLAPDGTISVVNTGGGGGGDDGGLIRVDLQYFAEPSSGVISNTGGDNAFLTLANAQNAGLMSPTDYNTLQTLKTNTITSVNLSYITANNGGIINNSAGDNVTLPLVNSVSAGLMAPIDYDTLEALRTNALIAVNLSYSFGSNTGVILNTGGDDVTLPSVTTTTAGLMTAADYNLLNSLSGNSGDDGSNVKLNDGGSLQIMHSKGLGLSTTSSVNNIAILLDTSTSTVSASTLSGEVVSATESINSVKTITAGTSVTADEVLIRSGGASVSNSKFNISIGPTNGTSLQSVTTGNNHIAIGKNSMKSMVLGEGNVAIGEDAMIGAGQTGGNNIPTSHSIGIGYRALANFNPTNNISDTLGLSRCNIAIGYRAGNETREGHANTVVGFEAHKANISGYENTVFGHGALSFSQKTSGNTAIGLLALQNYTFTSTTAGQGTNNVAVGKNTMRDAKNCQQNVAVGNATLIKSEGDYNTAIGQGALRDLTTGYNNTAIGFGAGQAISSEFNSTCLGNDASVTGSNQVQLGSVSTTTYTYGSVQNRSDARDKTDIRDTLLGLDFIKSLRPVDFRWNYREDYYNNEEYTEDGDALIRKVAVPQDGSRSRTRFHHGLIAQEVKQAADSQNVDFAGYQDHSIAGGDDVLSIGYNELIAPLIKAVQQLSAENEELKSRIQALE